MKVHRTIPNQRGWVTEDDGTSREESDREFAAYLTGPYAEMLDRMRNIDKSKPIYRVRYLENEKRRRATRFLNATSEDDARAKAELFGDVWSFESVELVPPEKIAQWEAMFPTSAENSGKVRPS